MWFLALSPWPSSVWAPENITLEENKKKLEEAAQTFQSQNKLIKEQQKEIQTFKVIIYKQEAIIKKKEELENKCSTAKTTGEDRKGIRRAYAKI